AARGTVASAARRGRASLVELLSRHEETRGRDCGVQTERRFKHCCSCKASTGWQEDCGETEARIKAMIATEFVVSRNDLQQCRTLEVQMRGELPDEALLVKVARFAFTANNITYATLGDHLKYWSLFPAPDGFGIIPVWGLGEVVASKHPGVPVGE